MLDFFDDDSMLGNKSVPFKLPNVGRPVSSISKPNGNFKLKPVVPKSTTVPQKEVMAKKPVITKKLAPVAISSPSNPPLAVRTSKSVTGFASKPSDIKEPTVSPRGNSSESKKTPATPPENMAACGNCGRFFNEDRVAKHESICKKQKKRKVFDGRIHRIQGTEAEVYVKKALKATPKKQKAPAAPTEKKSNWRKKHEEFIAAIRSAKQVQAHLAAGGKLSDVSSND